MNRLIFLAVVRDPKEPSVSDELDESELADLRRLRINLLIFLAVVRDPDESSVSEELDDDEELDEDEVSKRS
jgi:hypothetical protein